MQDSNRLLINPREALKLYKFATFDALEAGRSMAVAYQRYEGFDPDDIDDTLNLLACVWNAARIQGIREERLRNKQRIMKKKLLGCKPAGAIHTIGGRTIPVFQMGGFINTCEGWNLYVECSNAAHDAMEPYHDAKAAWEAQQQNHR